MKGSGEASGVVTFSFSTDQLIVKASAFSLTLLLAYHHQSHASQIHDSRNRSNIDFEMIYVRVSSET